jgi:hypothetical protein
MTVAGKQIEQSRFYHLLQAAARDAMRDHDFRLTRRGPSNAILLESVRMGHNPQCIVIHAAFRGGRSPHEKPLRQPPFQAMS